MHALKTGRLAAFRATLLVAAAIVAAGVAEGALRLTGYESHPYPVVQFGYPDPESIQQTYREDPDLFWVPRDYSARLNDARRRHPTVVFLGDSCTEFGQYPEMALELIAPRQPLLARGVKFGASGWSVVQGWAQLRRDVLPLHPRIVTIYYGWNDHWVALGPPDAEVRRARAFSWLADRSRLVQLIDRIPTLLRSPRTERPNRVDLATYQQTLALMIRAIQSDGGQAVVITAPSNHQLGREPEYLKVRHLRSLKELIPLHEAYVEATRRVTGAAGAILCDAAQAFRELPEPRDRYFRRDGIHLTDAGDREMARVVAGCIERADARLRPQR